MNNDFFSQINDTSKKKKSNLEEKSNNKIASIIKVVSWLILIIGIIVGIVIAVDDEVNEMVISIWLGSALATLFFLGFAEIIQLLQGIKNKIK